MTTAELQASLALWRARHAFRQSRLDAANQRDDRAGIEKWQRLRREAAAIVHRRERQLAAAAGDFHPGQVWMPGVRRDPRASCGPMVAGYAPKGVLHTTEGPTLESAFGALSAKNAWPHFCIGRDGTIVQHIPINQGARALEHPRNTAETNRGACIQIEIVGRAAEAGRWPDAEVQALRRVMRFVETAAGVARRSDARFHDADGVQRLDEDAWRRFSGWCGHQHVPHNHHWDPGPIDMGALL